MNPDELSMLRLRTAWLFFRARSAVDALRSISRSITDEPAEARRVSDLQRSEPAAWDQRSPIDASRCVR